MGGGAARQTAFPRPPEIRPHKSTPPIIGVCYTVLRRSRDLVSLARYDGAMRFTLRNFLLATPCFGLATAACGGYVRFRHAAAAATAQGHFVCTMIAPTLTPCMLLAADGIACLFGRYWIAAIVGILAVVCAALRVPVGI